MGDGGDEGGDGAGEGDGGEEKEKEEEEEEVVVVVGDGADPGADAAKDADDDADRAAPPKFSIAPKVCLGLVGWRTTGAALVQWAGSTAHFRGGKVVCISDLYSECS